MKKLMRFLFVAALAISLTTCKDNPVSPPGDKPGGDPGDPPITSTGTVKIQISLPEAGGLNLAGGTVFSNLQPADIDDSGNANAFANSGEVTPVWVFDKDENVVLAGFITDSSKVISAATTAKMLLYMGLQIPFDASDITEEYIRLIDQVPDAADWIEKFEELFKADPLVLSKGSFMNDLTETLKKLQDRRTLDPSDTVQALGDNVSDITINETDLRSGIQAFEDGLGQFSIGNHYRRRVYGFLYKMSYKDQNDKTVTVLDKISAGTKADKDFEIKSTSGVTSFLGEVGKVIEGSDLESYLVKTGPMDLSLEDNEKEASYKLRVVGTGVRTNLLTGKDYFMTQIEQDKWDRLALETFVFDFFFPTISWVGGLPGKEVVKKNPTLTKEILGLVEGQLKSPEVWEEILKGDYKKALEKFLLGLYSSATGGKLQTMLDSIKRIYALNSKNITAKVVTKAAAILKVTDIILSGSDLVRIYTDILASRSVEEWNLTARSAHVRLLPDEMAVIPYISKDIEAVIKNLQLEEGSHPFFAWSTSDENGVLTDSFGNSGASFESKDATIRYRTTTDEEQIGDDGKTVYVIVKGYLGSKVIGVDSLEVTIYKSSYRMLPTGITLSGKKGKNNAYNEVALYLVRKDSKPITGGANAAFDYKVIWTTAGAYGKLVGRNGGGHTTITTYNEAIIWYHATDDEVKEAKETITARIYTKLKEEADEWYHLRDEATGIVNIDNDDKKKIIHKPSDFLVFEEGDNYWVYPGVEVAIEDTAKAYKVVFYNWGGTLGYRYNTITYSWNVGEEPPTRYHPYPNNISGDHYFINWGLTHGNVSSSGEKIARYKTMYGNVQAEITYYY